ncbi:hypothetical protein [Vitiosangium sp. GDMCC 1.1324]|uniref:hypothetical protein n=1 Tax=Vitiosangium sp. (strain GDMCC 1.1324) TaxID=2138576 RepID=UPI000D355E5B|nr:hypothetical protein [Vitiosangium sp. GDMCC 1.1324]PTL78389.1 hypothetical protein DAT35_38275 [Vitiosangium sp. GDMCC 1.1324]
MCRTRSVSLALALGAMLTLAAGCGPVDPNFGNIPTPLSDRTCYTDADCTGNACCGEGTNPTHVQDGPDCSGVRCNGSCPVNGLDCGRCYVYCRDSRCEAACQG